MTFLGGLSILATFALRSDRLGIGVVSSVQIRSHALQGRGMGTFPGASPYASSHSRPCIGCIGGLVARYGLDGSLVWCTLALSFPIILGSSIFGLCPQGHRFDVSSSLCLRELPLISDLVRIDFVGHGLRGF